MSRTSNQTASMLIGFTVIFSATETMAAYYLPDMQPGPARRWEADVLVSTYSRVNTRHGNMFTAIPIMSWSGTGPDMDFMLYHNSANWQQTSLDTKNVGFFLGPGWSTSYSDHLIYVSTPPVHMLAVHADGTRDKFTGGGPWIAPAGVYDQLTFQAPSTWKLTHKDQSYHQFRSDSDGVIRLEKVVDNFGNETTIEYSTTTPKRLLSITTTAGGTAPRPIQFQYVGNKLHKIRDPWEDGNASQDRYWKFIYTSEFDGSDWMTAVDDPMDYRILFGYVPACGRGQRRSNTRMGTGSLKSGTERVGKELIPKQ